MVATAYKRGHKIYYDWDIEVWRYCDNNKIADYNRHCPRCGKMPTKEGYDACLGHIKGMASACCGHGEQSPIERKENDNRDVFSL